MASSLIEDHNAKSLETIRDSYFSQLPGRSWDGHTVTLHTAGSLGAPVFQQCFELLRDNMQDMYKRSSMGWKAASKKKEMKHPAMRYMILHRDSEVHNENPEPFSTDETHEGQWSEDETDSDGKIAGFLSFMVTEEEDEEVLYCYEVQIPPRFQGAGNGKRLMLLMESYGRAVGLKKSMLTVFVENQRAIKLYRLLGYSEDPISPVPWLLRSGETVRMPSYSIFSKSL